MEEKYRKPKIIVDTHRRSFWECNKSITNDIIKVLGENSFYPEAEFFVRFMLKPSWEKEYRENEDGKMELVDAKPIPVVITEHNCMDTFIDSNNDVMRSCNTHSVPMYGRIGKRDGDLFLNSGIITQDNILLEEEGDTKGHTYDSLYPKVCWGISAYLLAHSYTDKKNRIRFRKDITYGIGGVECCQDDIFRNYLHINYYLFIALQLQDKDSDYNYFLGCNNEEGLKQVKINFLSEHLELEKKRLSRTKSEMNKRNHNVPNSKEDVFIVPDYIISVVESYLEMINNSIIRLKGERIDFEGLYNFLASAYKKRNQAIPSQEDFVKCIKDGDLKPLYVSQCFEYVYCIINIINRQKIYSKDWTALACKSISCDWAEKVQKASDKGLRDEIGSYFKKK